MKYKIVSVLNKHYAMNTNEKADPSFLDCGTNRKRVVSFTHRPIYLKERVPRYPLGRKLSGPRAGLDRTGTRNPTPR